VPVLARPDILLVDRTCVRDNDGVTRPKEDVEAARDLLDQGLSIAETARLVGIARATVRDWMRMGFDEALRLRVDDRRDRGPCECCRYVRDLSETSYAYLLGLYLGDGYIARHPRGVYRLRIVQDDKYPQLIHECALAMNWVIPGRIGLVQKQGCTEVSSYSKHWPCLFPQHGLGRKHMRRIELEPWQRWVAMERHPHLLLRGLIHSDGCRFNNRLKVRGRSYEYARYQFTNRSDDIRRIFTDACGRAGVEWRQMNRWNISVAKRTSVRTLDQFIGPKC
jgi:hypothetical protein